MVWNFTLKLKSLLSSNYLEKIYVLVLRLSQLEQMHETQWETEIQFCNLTDNHSCTDSCLSLTVFSCCAIFKQLTTTQKLAWTVQSLRSSKHVDLRVTNVSLEQQRLQWNHDNDVTWRKGRHTSQLLRVLSVLVWNVIGHDCRKLTSRVWSSLYRLMQLDMLKLQLNITRSVRWWRVCFCLGL